MEISNDAPTSEFVCEAQAQKYATTKVRPDLAETYQFLFDKWVHEYVSMEEITDIVADLALLHETHKQESMENGERAHTPHQLTGSENHNKSQEGGE